MRSARTYAVVCLSLALTISAFAQTPSSSPQARTLLQNSLAALSGGKSIADITLSGTARRVVGPDDESGTATLKAITRAGRMDLSLPSGSRSEIVNLTTSPASGSWSGPDGVSHSIAPHNLWTEPAWFSPQIAVA